MQKPPNIRTEPAERLARALIEITGYLSSLANDMVAFQLRGLAAPDSPPIPEAMANLLSSVLDDVERIHGRAKLLSAAKVVEATLAQAEQDIFAVNPELLEEPDEPF